MQRHNLHAEVCFRRNLFGAVAEDFAFGGVVAAGEAAHAAEGAGEVHNGTAGG